MGNLLGHGVRFGTARDVLAAGEGIETMLSLHCVLPDLPLVAALSANHLAALQLGPGLRRLYVARDNDAAGRRAAGTLGERAEATGIEAMTLTPMARAAPSSRDNKAARRRPPLPLRPSGCRPTPLPAG
jgi:hypothetical protein